MRQAEPRKLALVLLFMRAIAEGLLFREATATELGIFDCGGHVSISIDEIDCAGDADRSAFWVDESLDRISWLAFRHGYGLIEIVAESLRT